MKLLTILVCLFLFGCSNGGFKLSSEREPQKVFDLDLLASDGLVNEENLVNVDSAGEDDAVAKPSTDLVAKHKVKDRSKKPQRRRFGKRERGSERRRFGKRSFGKRKDHSDLEATVVEVKEDIKNKVDILFVVDGSFSTKEVLRSIPERMNGFIPALDDLDWRVGFIGAHVKRNQDKELSSMELDGALVLERKYITSGTVSNERIFIDSLTRNSDRRRCLFPPQCGKRKETPLLALTEYVLSPTRSVENGTRFIRDEAHLAVVILTDNKENKIQGQTVTADDVLDTMAQEFGNDKEFSVHTLTAMDDACQGQLKQDHFFAEGNRAWEMLLLAKETGGANLSLCSYDYATPLASAIEKSVLGEEVDCSACADAVSISDKEKTV